MIDGTVPRVLLCTSQPPLTRQARSTGDGRDVTREYAELCRASWRTPLTTPLSINSLAEVGSGFEDACDAHLLVDRDAAAFAGKPLVHLDDLLGALDGYPEHTHLAIINADIMLDVGSEPGRMVPPGSTGFIAAARVDVSHPDQREGRRFRHGYDVVVLTREQVDVVRGSEFIIGAPWWDHFVPVALILAGHVPATDHPPLAYSLFHGGRWDELQWAALGEGFVRAVTRRLRPFHLLRRHLIRYVAVTLFARTVLGGGLGRLPGGLGVSVRTLVLDRVSKANIRLVEGARR